jgi:hypothetical protein
MAVPVTTLGLNVGQNQYDVVATTGTATPAQQIQITFDTSHVTIQQAALIAMLELQNYIISRGWPVA